MYLYNFNETTKFICLLFITFSYYRKFVRKKSKMKCIEKLQLNTLLFQSRSFYYDSNLLCFLCYSGI